MPQQSWMGDSLFSDFNFESASMLANDLTCKAAMGRLQTSSRHRQSILAPLTVENTDKLEVSRIVSADTGHLISNTEERAANGLMAGCAVSGGSDPDLVGIGADCRWQDNAYHNNPACLADGRIRATSGSHDGCTVTNGYSDGSTNPRMLACAPSALRPPFAATSIACRAG